MATKKFFWIYQHNTTLKELEEEVDKKKFSGLFLHDGDIYTPREINDILDDIKQLIHQKIIK